MKLKLIKILALLFCLGGVLYFSGSLSSACGQSQPPWPNSTPTSASGGVPFGGPPQIVGYGPAGTGEAEMISADGGDCPTASLTRTAAGAYGLTLGCSIPIGHLTGVSGVTPGTYTCAGFSVNALGLLTSASSGSCGGGGGGSVAAAPYSGIAVGASAIPNPSGFTNTYQTTSIAAPAVTTTLANSFAVTLYFYGSGGTFTPPSTPTPNTQGIAAQSGSLYGVWTGTTAIPSVGIFPAQTASQVSITNQAAGTVIITPNGGTPSLGNSSTCQAVATAPCPLTVPSGVVAGDAMLMCVGQNEGAPPSGTAVSASTSIGHNQASGVTPWCYGHVATNSEPSTYTFNGSGGFQSALLIDVHNGVFSNPGPSAIAQSQPVFYVTDYGAKCDGVTDDTAAFNAAIAAAEANGFIDGNFNSYQQGMVELPQAKTCKLGPDGITINGSFAAMNGNGAKIDCSSLGSFQTCLTITSSHGTTAQGDNIPWWNQIVLSGPQNRDVLPGSAFAGSASKVSSLAAPAITTAVNNSLVFSSFSMNQTGFTPPVTPTPLINMPPPTSNGEWGMWVGTQLIASAGVVAAQTMTMSTNYLAAASIVVPPNGGTPTLGNMTTCQGTGGNTCTMTIPSGTSNGDLLFECLDANFGTPVPNGTAVTAFTPVGQSIYPGVTQQCYSKIANNESAPYIFGPTGNAQSAYLIDIKNGGTPSISDTTGILLEDAQVIIHQPFISGFTYGIEFWNFAYGDSIYGPNINNTGTDYYCPFGANDAGEQINTYGGSLFNSKTAVENDACEMNFFGTAFDYNFVQSILANGFSVTRIYAPHIETSIQSGPVFQWGANCGSTWGNISVFGGDIFSTSGTNPNVYSFFDNNCVTSGQTGPRLSVYGSFIRGYHPSASCVTSAYSVNTATGVQSPNTAYCITGTNAQNSVHFDNVYDTTGTRYFLNSETATPACSGSVTLSSGTGTFTNACVFAGMYCTGSDVTAGVSLPATDFVQSSGSSAITVSGGSTDVVREICQ